MWILEFSSNVTIFLIMADLIESNDPTKLDPASVFKTLVGTMNYRWFDLFKALGLSHNSLEEIRQKHPYDPNVSLFEAILKWLRGNEPTPSWKALADTLSLKFLESKLATEIAEKHFSAKENAEAEKYKEGKIFWN